MAKSKGKAPAEAVAVVRASTSEDVAKAEGVRAQTVNRWARELGCPHAATPKGRRFNLEEVHAWRDRTESAREHGGAREGAGRPGAQPAVRVQRGAQSGPESSAAPASSTPTPPGSAAPGPRAPQVDESGADAADLVHPPAAVPSALDLAKASLREVEMRRAELKLSWEEEDRALKLGQLLRTVDVEATWEAHLHHATAMLGLVPGKAAREIASMLDARDRLADVERLVRRQIDRALAAIREDPLGRGSASEAANPAEPAAAPNPVDQPPATPKRRRKPKAGGASGGAP